MAKRMIRWVGVVALAAAATWGGVARAAIAQPTAWTQQYAGTAYPTSAGTLTIAAGTNRLLLVAIASRTSTAAAQTLTSVTYGNQQLTLAQGDAASTAQDHTYFYYLKDAGIAAATSTSLSVSMSGGTAAYTWVYAAVFSGVNQATPFTNTQNFNSLSTATGTVAFATPGLTMNTSDWPFEVILLQRSTAGGTVRQITTGWATNWGSNGGTLPVSLEYVDNATSGYLPQIYIAGRVSPTANVQETSSHTVTSASTYASMTGISLQTAPVTSSITIGNGSAEPANGSVGSTGVGAIDAFSVQTSSGNATIASVTVNLAFSAGTPLTAVSVNSNATCTGTSYGSLPSPVAGSNAITLGTSIAANTTSSTTNLYVCGTGGLVASSATVTGTVTAVAATGYTSTSNDTTSATLTVLPTVTVGNGSSEPASTAVYSGKVGAIDAFSLQTSGGNATVTAVKVNLTFSAGTPLTNVFVNSTSACTGTTYGTLASPVSGANTINLGTSFVASTTSGATNLYLCGTGAAVAASATVTGTVGGATATGYGSVSNDTASATLTVSPSIAIGNGSAEPGNGSITSGAVGAIDAFSVQTSAGNATITGVTVNLAFSAGTPLANVFVNGTSACTGTTYGTLANPVAGSNAITLSTGIGATTTSSATNLYVCGTAATVAANATVTATVSSVTASGYVSATSGDTGSSTLTVTPPPSISIGNGSAEPGNKSITSGAVGAIDAFSVQTSAGNATITGVTVNLAFSAGTPLANVFVNATSACTGTTYGTLASPVAGSNAITLSTSIGATTTSSATNLYVCGTAATVAANATVTATVSSVTASGYVSATSGDTGSSTLTVTPPPTITVGNGSPEAASSTISTPAAGPIDAFSVQTNGGNATVTVVTVNLAFSAGAPLTNVFVSSASGCSGGTTYGTLSGPVSGSNTVALSTGIPATPTSSTTNLYVCGTAATVSATATVTGTVSSVTASGYGSTSSDTGSATLTVNLPGTTTGSVTAKVASCTQVNASASYTGDTDGDNTVTFSRSTDGTSFVTLASCTNLAGGNPRVCNDTTASASTSYWYRAQFTDATGGVAGTNPITTAASVNTGACPANLILSDPSTVSNPQPAPGTLTVGAASWSYVGQFALAASANTLTLDSVGVANGATGTPASGGDLQLNLVNAAGTAVDSTGRWDGAKWVFASILDGTTGQPLAIGTAATTFRVYATASYGAAGGETFAMKVDPANVVALAPASATTGSSVAGSTFTTAAPASTGEGALADGGAPMVSIANPEKGKIVSGAFLVQVYVYSANASAISAMGITTDGTTPACSVNDATITKDLHAYSSASAAMYSKTVSLAVGTYTLKACAKNTVGATASAPVTITVRAAGAGDGNLLVRDNSSQLCTDCHDQSKIKTHSSEAVRDPLSGTSKYGTWVANCRDCHTPHSTRNLYLVREQIVPPGVNGYQTTKDIRFATTAGDSGVNGVSTPASSSFANTDGSGPCQACHTRTMNPSRSFTNATFTNASTTVTTGSSVFVSGTAPAGDVGNYVLAPDGRSYKISAVVSATQATLSTAYQGATTGAGTARLLVGPSRWRSGENGDSHLTAAAGTSACTGCHSHKGGFAASESTGGGNCSSCHNSIWSTMTGATASKHALGTTLGTNDSYVDSGVNWGTQTQLSAIGAAQRSCVNMCHDDHVHDLSTATPSTTHEQNVYADARNSTARAMTRDANGNVTAGTPGKTDFSYNASTQAWGGMCGSCHQTQVDANRPAIAISQFAGSGHDTTATTDGTATYAWSYGLHDGSAFQRNCTKCHASRAEGTTPAFGASGSKTVAVHGTTDPSLLAGGTSLQNAATSPFVCWNCHGSASSPAAGAQGNRSAHDVQTAISKAYDHPDSTTDALHNTVTERSATYNGGQLSGSNRHAACMDCHDPHEAGKMTHANGTNAVTATSPLYGVSGLAFTPPATNWTATASANFTWKNGVSASVAHEYELCLKCHSSFAYGSAPPVDANGSSTTDQSLEFSTSNQSYHPVAGALPATDPGANGSSQLAATQLCTTASCPTGTQFPAGTQFWAPGQTMYCSDCHGNDTASPAVQGPHGSSVKYVLKGPNHCWPYTASGTTCTTTLQSLGSNPTNGTFLTGNFCLNCHPLFTGTTNSAANWAGNIVHYNHSGPQVSSVECVRCHILVPHGGKVSRLIATATAGLPARYQIAATPPEVTQFMKSTTGPGGYSTSNCNTTCSGHGTVATPETW